MQAISSPLLETNITGATGVLVSITASEDIQLDEIDAASNMIYEEAHPDANIIWGAAFDPTLQDEMRVTVIATGFIAENAEAKKAEPVARAIPTPVVEAPVAQPAPSFEESFNRAEVALAPEAPKAAEPTKASYEDIYGSVYVGIKKQKK